jgi:pimeloyl-ACP methyl ester carboxylesterase
MRHWVMAVCLMISAAACSSDPPSPAGSSPPVTVETAGTGVVVSSATPDLGASAGPVDVGGREIFLTCAGPTAPGAPTVVLVSGYRDSADVWTESALLSLLPGAVGPPVFEALARSTRVCAYDRPGTVRYIDQGPLTDRTSPVEQPRTAGDLVVELHQLLAAADVPAPYVLMGHSLGGLVTLLYARTHPEQVAGVVFDDAFSPTIPVVFGDLWPIYRDELLNPSPDRLSPPSLALPDAERIDLDVSIRQVEQAPPLSPLPLVMVTKTKSFAGLDESTAPPGITADQVNQLYEQAEDDFVAMSPATPHIFATGSEHYVQWSQPDLLVNAVELVLTRAAS